MVENNRVDFKKAKVDFKFAKGFDSDYANSLFYYPTPNLNCQVQALENRINNLTESFKKIAPKIFPNAHFEFSPISNSQKAEGFFIGYVSSDNGERLNRASCFLQGCQKISEGNRIRMRFDNLEIGDNLSLFPGQVIVVQGDILENSTENFLSAKRIFCDFNEIEENDSEKAIKSPFKSMIISGPFCSAESIFYKDSPLKMNLNLFQKNIVDLIILMGPIIPIKHKLVLNKKLKISYEDASKNFLIEFLLDLKKIFDKNKTNFCKIVVIPSSQDITGEILIPSPTYKMSKLIKEKIPNLEENVIFCSNPTQFNFSGFDFAVIDSDFVFDLLGSDLRFNLKGKKETKRWSQLSSHIVTQKHFYPIYPPKSVFVDYSKYDRLNLESVDFLIWNSPSTKVSNKIAGIHEFRLKNEKEIIGIFSGNVSSINNTKGIFIKISFNPLKEKSMREQILAEILKLE